MTQSVFAISTAGAQAFDQLMVHARETAALEQVAGRLGWDQETMMPRGAAEQRAEEMSAMEGVLHARRTDPRLADLLEQAEAGDVAGRAQIAKIKRSYLRAQKIPAALSQEIVRVTSLAQGIWAGARAREDVAAFLPSLHDVVRLRREEASALAQGGDLYDALLDDYEPGSTGAQVSAMFDALRPRLVALRDKVLGASYQPAALTGSYSADSQMRLARDMAQVFGYDLSRGRVDMAVHPFCSGSGQDVRVTTRVVEADPFNCLFSTIHEVGHAGYEQAIDPDYLLTPIGQGASMGVHESQSRICENQLARSKAFSGWLFGQMSERFGKFGIADQDAFYATVNRVTPGFIRTEADEIHYNLHIMMRFDLERDLISGALSVADLETAWNDRFFADFGAKVDRPSHGMLQDVHWSLGLMGYFPTYSLGNLYAGCLHQAMRSDLPNLDVNLAKGDVEPALAWLHQNLRRFGALYEPNDLIEGACGFAPSAEPLLSYLEAKFGEIYKL